MTLEEMEATAASIAVKINSARSAIDDIKQLRQMNIEGAHCLVRLDDVPMSYVMGDLLREVLRAGIAAVIERKEIEVSNLLQPDRDSTTKGVSLVDHVFDLAEQQRQLVPVND